MPVFNKIKLGVRSKIFTASLVIALMLLLSGALAFFELGRMSRYISDFISNSSDSERQMADSVRYAYSAYMQVAQEIESVWLRPQEERTDWYFNRLQTVYTKLRGYLQRLSDTSQSAITDSYNSLQDSYYRSIMPGVIASAASIVLIILFVYFLNHYVVHPMLRMSRGLSL